MNQSSFTKLKPNFAFYLFLLLWMGTSTLVSAQQEFCDESCTPVCAADENNTLTVGCSFLSLDIADVLVTQLSQGGRGNPIPESISCTTPFINDIRGDGEFEFLSCSDEGTLEGGTTIEDLIGGPLCEIIDGIEVLGVTVFPNLLPEGEFCGDPRELECDDSILGLLLAALQTQFDGMNGGVTFFVDTDGDGTFDFQRNQGNSPTLPGSITDNIPNNVVGAGCITVRVVASFPRAPADFCGEIAPEISLIDLIAPAFEAIPIAGPIIPSLLVSNGCDTNLSFFRTEDFTIRVENDQAPVFVNAPTTDFVFTGDCGAAVNWSIPVAIDACSGELLTFRGMGSPDGTPGLWQTAGPEVGTILAPGTYPVTYEAQGCDLTAMTTFNVVVTPDVQMLVCSPDLTVPTDTDGCTATVIGLEPFTGMGCNTRLSYAISGATTVNAMATSTGQLLVPNGTVFNCGQSTVMYTLEADLNLDGDFEDMVNGFPETQTCSFIVTVEDNQIPTTLCKDIDVQLGVDGTVTINASDQGDGLHFVDANSTDNCTSQTDLIYSLNFNGTEGESITFGCENSGKNSVMLSVSDVDCVTGMTNNTMTCLSQVNVINFFEGWDVTLDVPEVCFENTNTTINFADYLTIQHPSGNEFTHADILANANFNGIFTIVNGTSLNGSYSGALSQDGVFTSNLADAFANISIEYRLSLSAAAGCFVNGRDVFEVRRPMDVTNAHCNCPNGENIREVNLGDLFGVDNGAGGFFPVGEGPYTIQYTGGVLTDGMGNIIDLNDNGTIIYDYAYNPGTVVDNFGVYWGSGNMLDDDTTPDDLIDNPVIGPLLAAENNSSTIFPMIGGAGTRATGGAFDLGSIVTVDLGADGILNTIDDVPLDGQWSFTIIDGRGCEVFRSGECTQLETEIHGPSGPVCMDDPVIEFFDARTQPSLSQVPFGFPACETSVGGANFDPSWEFYEVTFNGPSIIDAAVIPGGILSPNLGGDPIPDNTVASILSVIAGQGTVQLNPDALEANFPQGGQFLIRMYVDRHQCHDPLSIQDESSCLEIFETQILIYPSFDACWDMPLEICGNAPAIRVDVNEFEPGYDDLSAFYDLDEISIWDLITPSGTIIGTGTNGMLWLEDDLDTQGRFVLEGLIDGDVRFYPEVLFENFGPGTYTLNHELGIENCRASCSVVFEILPVPEVATSTTMPNVCCSDEFDLIIDSLVSGTQIYEYQWTEAITGFASPMVSFPVIPIFQDTLLPADTLVVPVSSLPGGCPASGVYDFVLTLTDSKGCQIMDTVAIAINMNPMEAPEVTPAIFCAANKASDSSPLKGISFSSSILNVECNDDVIIVGDSDGDRIPDVADADLNLFDFDRDGIPNAADADLDGDGVVDLADPDVDNDLVFENGPDQDGDNIADACDPDFTAGVDNDNNGILDICENDMDGDGILDACDSGAFDTDGDGLVDAIDADIVGLDTDDDGITDFADSDLDGDGIPNVADADFTGSDNDGDGINDLGDIDDDNDLIPDNADHNPLFAFDNTDSNGNEINNACDVAITGGVDANNNQIDDACELAADDFNGDSIDDVLFISEDNNLDGIIDFVVSQDDVDSDGVLDVCDVDSDNDGINDQCDIDQNPGATDSDGDGIIDACDVLVYPVPNAKWYLTETSTEQLFDFDADSNGIMDSDKDGNVYTFDPIAAGLVDPLSPGEYTFYVECFTIPNMKCQSPRQAVTLTVLDCDPADDECTYLLVLEDLGGDGWDGASIDVVIDEIGPGTNYKLTNEDCDLRIIPISTNDGGLIDLTYWAGAKENEHRWTLYAPDGSVALDDSGSLVGFSSFPPSNQTISVKLDCPARCVETEEYYIVNTIGNFADNQVWELRDASGELVAFNSFQDYSGLSAGTVVVDTVQLASCEDYSFTSFAPNSVVWANATWQIIGSDQDRGTLVSDGPFEGLYEIAGGPNGNFVDEQITDFNLPCAPEDCPSDELVQASDILNCELTGFVHPSPPTPFVCYPTGCYSNTTPTVTISYPDLGIDRVDVATAVTLPVGANLVVFEVTYGGVQTVRCTSKVNVVSDLNPILTCNDHLNISLSNISFATSEDCFRTVDIDEVTEGLLLCPDEYELIIFDVEGNRLSPPNVVGPDQVGQTLTYKVEHIGSGNSCGGTLLIEDKNAPLIDCTDYEVACTHPNFMDENFTHSERFSAIELPANISGSTGSSITTTIEVDNTPLGEIIQGMSLDVVNNHSRTSDISITLTSPSGMSITSGLPFDSNAFAGLLGSTFESIGGTWTVTIVDNNGDNDNGNFGQGSIFEINLDVQAGFRTPVLVLDCSPVTFSVINEIVEDTNCDQSEWLGARLIRTWQAIDASGNASTCEQIIGIRAPRMDDINLPQDMTLECGDVSSDPAMITTDISGSPTFGPYELTLGNSDNCDLTVIFSDQVLEACGNSFSILRTWEITNWCSLTTTTHVQTVFVNDTKGPEINTANIQYATGSTDCETGNVFLSPSVVDACSNVTSIIVTYNDGGGLYDEAGVLIIQDITDGSALNDLPLGLTEISIFATDDCGNVTEQLVEVNTVDPVSPNAVCNDGLNISLSSNGTAILLASDLDEGSFDNCGIASIQARRVSGCIDTTQWADSIPFECCDADQLIIVELLVTDLQGNTNVCWSEVSVEDPIGPQIECADDITITCDEALHADDLFVAPEVSDNCNTEISEGEVVTVDLPNCGQLLTKTYTVTDGSDKTNDANCIQSIIVEHVSDFIVQFPADADFDNCELGAIGEPIITDGDCEMISISSSDRIFTQTANACYLIERTWTVINQCIVDNPGDDGFTDLGTPLPIPRTFRDDDGYFQYVQLISVNDEVAPSVAFTAPDPCDFTDGCEGALTLTATGEDDCSELADLSFSWKIDAGSNGTFELEGDGADASGTYPYGDHIIKWTVIDGCGNVTSEEYEFSVQDCKNPTPIADGLATVVMNDGNCVEITAAHLLKEASDNCTVRTDEEWQANARVRVEGDNGALAASILVCCDDVENGGVNVEVWVDDEAGNADFVIVFVQVQDNSGNCPSAAMGASLLAGRTATETGNNVEAVSVSVGDNVVLTDADGVYTSVETSGQMYTVTPEKLDNFEQYLSTLDIVFMAQHILQINTLTTPYQLIAADVDADGDVDIFDLVELRQVVLFEITEGFTNNTAWRFVDASYTFQNPTAPWAEDYPQYIDAMLINNLTGEDFIAVKIGDLDGSAASSFNALEERSFPTTLTMNIDDIEMTAGAEYKVDFRASDFTDVTGYQFTMKVDSKTADFVSVEAGALKVNESNFGLTMLDEGIITTSFADMGKGISVSDDEVLFSINFIAKSNATLHEVLSLTNQYTLAEAYNTESEVSDMKLAFNNVGLVTTTGGDFELLQNSPNPFNVSTTIGINLPESTEGSIVFYDIAGREVYQMEKHFERGYNEVVIDRADLLVSGTLIYQFKSADYNAEKKLIIID